MRGVKEKKKRKQTEKGDTKMGREIYDVYTSSVKANG